ncbi:unnamed protein product [Boreogadus saida]
MANVHDERQVVRDGGISGAGQDQNGSLWPGSTPSPKALDGSSPSAGTMSTTSPTDFDSLEIQQQYNDINNRWDLAAETDWDNENSSARLFERSRIKALAGHLLMCSNLTVCALSPNRYIIRIPSC